jgi:hypothetical protein
MNLVRGNVAANGLNNVAATMGSIQYGIYNYRQALEDQSNRHLHFKTNVQRGQNQMIMIEAVGYNYGTGQPIRCSWAWYSYGVDNLLYNVALHNLYNGLVPNAVYHSTDNFVCFSAGLKNLYFTGMVLNAYAQQHGHGDGFLVNITAAGTTTSAGNLY